jgi:hypothetical protein
MAAVGHDVNMFPEPLLYIMYFSVRVLNMALHYKHYRTNTLTVQRCNNCRTLDTNLAQIHTVYTTTGYFLKNLAVLFANQVEKVKL